MLGAKQGGNGTVFSLWCDLVRGETHDLPATGRIFYHLTTKLVGKKSPKKISVIHKMDVGWMKFLPLLQINLHWLRIHVIHQGLLHFTLAVVDSVESVCPSDGTTGQETSDIHPLFPCASAISKRKKPVGLHSNSVWGAVQIPGIFTFAHSQRIQSFPTTPSSRD